MNKGIKRNTLCIFVFLFSVLTSVTSQAWESAGFSIGFGDDNVHYHDGYRGGYGRYYDRGGYFYGRGWSGPNVIINVPVERYYVPVCNNVEVCDSSGECWLERYCD